MDPHNLAQSTPAQPDPIDLVRLTRSENRFLVHPPAHLRLPSFVLPPLPMSVTNRCLVMAQSFWATHRRCIGFLLLMDCENHRWGCGIPTQRCSADAACWNINRRDFDELPASSVVAGSFQSRVVSNLEELVDAPPPCPGLHLVHRVGGDYNGPEIATFLRAGEICLPIQPEVALFDDWSAALTDFQ